MHAQVLIRTKIIEAPPDGTGGPRWVAVLEDGTYVVGKPSWASSGPVALPDAKQRMSDWRRLMEKCREERKVIRRLTLFVPGVGVFPAPGGRGGYGYFETQVASRTQKGCEALSLCWPERDKRGAFIKVIKVYATGQYEEWRRSSWLPCMIGDPQFENAAKGIGVQNVV